MGDWANEAVDEVVREVRSIEWQGKPARVVAAARSYATDPADLWDAITDPARLKRWFLPISGELREGGHYQFDGNAGGTIDRCEAPRHLAVTWEFNGGLSWVNVTLEADGSGATRLLLEHIGLEDEAGLAFWQQFGPGAVGVGWDLGLYGLAEHLRTGEGKPEQGEEEWLATGEGRAFATASSEAWYRAALAFGTDESAARGAADRTTAFYTGGGEA
ncbi:SRPBCC family protein [Pelagerythrobacter marensis]|uniref:SRPBCC family protein n=1 Tax=Pelagerythrobacter marensis TaxID=543877 RepID=A0ABZ2D7D1_9SPHN